MDRKNQHNKISGFTLIEAVVAASVFAFVVSSTLAVYMATLKVDTKTRAQRTVIQNARFIMDFVAKEVRNGLINYSAYPGGLANPTDTLYIVNDASEAEQLTLNGVNLVLTKPAGSTNLNSSQVKITKLLFYVSPVQDPLTPARLANQQPSVTIVMEVTSNYGSNPADAVKINIQSTFEVRSYPSRLP
jgi:type II secretory pathway pseudopilin PulG